MQENVSKQRLQGVTFWPFDLPFLPLVGFSAPLPFAWPLLPLWPWPLLPVWPLHPFDPFVWTPVPSACPFWPGCRPLLAAMASSVYAALSPFANTRKASRIGL